MTFLEQWRPARVRAQHTRHSFVRDKLREAILQGHLKPGDRLDQNELAELFKVSRSPVRTALISLAAEGLVYNEPHRGSIVAELGPDELEEIYQIRKVLEGIAARQGAPHLTEEQVQQMAEIVEQLDGTFDASERVLLNQGFHDILYRAARRPRLFALIQTLSNTALPYTHLHFNEPRHWDIASKGHRRILVACLARDGEAAQQAAEAHIQEVCESMLENWGRRPPRAMDSG